MNRPKVDVKIVAMIIFLLGIVFGQFLLVLFESVVKENNRKHGVFFETDSIFREDQWQTAKEFRS